MKSIYYLLLLLCPYMSKAQQIAGPVGMNDTAPDLVFKNVINAAYSQIKLSRLKAKLTVINFMATTCTGCIKALPLIDSLQQANEKEVKVLIVSYEKPDRIQAFLKRRPGLRLPFVPMGDHYKKLFPHEYISHLVWLNSDRKVIAITGADYFTAGNIKAALNNNTGSWPVKDDAHSDELAPEGTTPLSRFDDSLQRSALWPQNAAYPTTWRFEEDTVQDISTLTIANKPLLFYSRMALDEPQWPLAFIRTYNTDPAMLVFDPAIHLKAAWQQAFFFSYQSVAKPAQPKEQQMQKMLRHIEQYFGLQVYMKDSCIQVYALMEKDHRDTIDENTVGNYNKLPGINSIIQHLNNRALGVMPVIDKRSNRSNIRIPFPQPLPTDPLELNKFLAAYNLQLIPCLEHIPVMVIASTGHAKFLSPAKTYLK